MPFTGNSIRGILPDEITAQIALKKAIHSGSLSAAIGKFIALGNEFVKRGAQEVTEVLIIASYLKGAMSDVIPSFAIVMWFVKEVCWPIYIYNIYILFTCSERIFQRALNS